MSRAHFLPSVVLAPLMVILLAGSSVRGQTVDAASRAAARDLGTQGVQAYQAGDYAAAKDRLERAYRVLTVPSLGLWYGRALAKQGLIIEASEVFLEVSRLPTSSGDRAVQEQAQKDAVAEREPLLARIGGIRIQVENANPQEVEVLVDGAVVSSALLGVDKPTNPGRHQLVGKRGAETVEQTIDLADGEKKPVVLRFSTVAALPPVPPPASSTSAAPPPPPVAPPPPVTSAEREREGLPPWLTYAAWGLGGLGVAVGATTATMAYQLRQGDKMSDACTGEVCSPAVRSDVDRYNNLRLFSTIGFITGGVGLAAAVTLTWIVPGSSQSESSRAANQPGGVRDLRAWVGPNGLAVSGSF